MAEDQSSSKIALDEWKETRSTIARFEGYLDSLRRYGFSFIAALLAANSFQIYFGFTNFAKSFITVITVAFIVSLYFFDTYNRQIVEAASIRARVLEIAVLSNIELNDTILDKFEQEKLPDYIKSIYIGFIIIAVVVGVVVIIAAPAVQSSTIVNSSTPSKPSINFVTILFVIGLNILFAILFFVYKGCNKSCKRYKKSIHAFSAFLASYIIVVAYLVNSKTLSGISVNPKMFVESVQGISTMVKNFQSVISDNLISLLIILLGLLFAILFFHKYFNELIYLESFIQAFFVIVLISDFIITSHLICQYSVDIEFAKNYISLLMLVGGLGTLLIDYFSKDLVIKYKKAEVVEIKDWIIDKFSCEQGEKLKITITNLDKNELKFQKGTDICTVYLEDGSWSKDLLNENSEITIPSYSSYSLFWDTRDVPKEGIYRVKPYGKDRPLRRSIFVRTKIKHQESPDDDG